MMAAQQCHDVIITGTCAEGKENIKELQWLIIKFTENIIELQRNTVSIAKQIGAFEPETEWNKEERLSMEEKASSVFKFQPATTQTKIMGSHTDTPLVQDGVTQTDTPLVQGGATQTPVCTYVGVVAQTEVRETGGPKDGGPKDSMDRDVPITPQDKPAVPTTAKDPIKDKVQTPAYSARAFVVHGVACKGHMKYKIREVKNAFHGKGGEVIGVRWLLSRNRRRGKGASSLVVVLNRSVPIEKEMSVRMWAKKYTVVEYEWERKFAKVVS